jgi:adenylate cyclase
LLDADRILIVLVVLTCEQCCCDRYVRDAILMRRKIAAILVAHIADYGRLVADDEEETLRRMASCRTTIDDIIAVGGGRIFNTAGDAILAEFASAVEAVRCAIDIQESLRTRNLAYPDSRQMSYRIGLGIGDVVEREGDLLGDGVNIAARLEGLAEVGGICISRAVYEQVTGKLSARFIDIGARKVKNIPEPVHAYIVATWDDARSNGMPQATAASASAKSARSWLSVALVGVIALCAVTGAFFLASQRPDGKASPSPTTAAALPPVPPTPPPIASSPPSSSPVPAIRRTNSVVNEPDATKRSLQSCEALATQRGWTTSSNDVNGRRAFIAACTQGVRE